MRDILALGYRKLLQEEEFLLVSDEKMRGKHFVCSQMLEFIYIERKCRCWKNVLLDALYRAKNYCFYYINYKLLQLLYHYRVISCIHTVTTIHIL